MAKDVPNSETENVLAIFVTVWVSTTPSLATSKKVTVWKIITFISDLQLKIGYNYYIITIK